jgi:ABC-type multidrug transport system ATPase subunit
MSLYQGSDDMVPLFDKVAVINSGHCIYYGNVVAANLKVGLCCNHITVVDTVPRIYDSHFVK